MLYTSFVDLSHNTCIVCLTTLSTLLFRHMGRCVLSGTASRLSDDFG